MRFWRSLPKSRHHVKARCPVLGRLVLAPGAEALDHRAFRYTHPVPNEQILALLLAERDRLNRAIEALGGPKRRGRPPGRTLSAAGRKAIAEGQRKRWAAIRAKRA